MNRPKNLGLRIRNRNLLLKGDRRAGHFIIKLMRENELVNEEMNHWHEPLAYASFINAGKIKRITEARFGLWASEDDALRLDEDGDLSMRQHEDNCEDMPIDDALSIVEQGVMIRKGFPAEMPPAFIIEEMARVSKQLDGREPDWRICPGVPYHTIHGRGVSLKRGDVVIV